MGLIDREKGIHVNSRANMNRRRFSIWNRRLAGAGKTGRFCHRVDLKRIGMLRS